MKWSGAVQWLLLAVLGGVLALALPALGLVLGASPQRRGPPRSTAPPPLPPPAQPPAPPPPYAPGPGPATPVYSVSVSGVVPGWANRSLHKVHVGVVLPHSTFRARHYRHTLVTTLTALAKTKPGLVTGVLGQSHDIVATVVTVSHKPSPTTILNILCQHFLRHNVSAILLLSNSETYGRETASAEYFMQLADYLRIPVIAWNNAGLERRTARSSLQLQLAPSLAHQAAAVLSVLQRYKWHQFSVVASQIAGHDEFIQAVRDAVHRVQGTFKLVLLQALVVSPYEPDLGPLVSSETRIVLLYCTREEAKAILAAAAKLRLNGTDYLWLATQSVIGSAMEAPDEFPVGMLGIHFPTDSDELLQQLSRALRVFATALEQFVRDAALTAPAAAPAAPGALARPRHPLLPRLSCEGGAAETRWAGGELFYRYLRASKVEQEGGRAALEFQGDGSLRAAQLQVLNLQPQRKMLSHKQWVEIGAWKSWEGAGLGAGLDVRDIVWPGMSHTPPQGVPEKFHLRIAFLEEPPYVNLEPLDPVTNKCPMNRGVHCRVGREDNPSARRCCSGFCIDLLHKFAEDLGFTFDLFRVEDGKWGAQTNGRWNGLVAALMNHNAELVMTSLKINYERSQAIDFSLPFLDTGIAIVVAKRTGIISPTAFLEPFDSDMWMLVALGAVHIAAIAIFVFEWVTPAGYDRELGGGGGGPREHRVSLCRTLWLVWAVLFQAAVNVDCPRGYTARCMANVWAMFALIFLAIYTANLAAFMITREEFHELSGINDTKLNNPYSLKPPFRFGTIPHGNTDAVLRRNFPQMHGYMRQYNRSSVADGVRAVKDGSLDAFLYDATVLDYLAGQDADCVLVTVGSWFAMTGYGVGFPRHSKYRPLINRLLMEYRENGDLERLRRYWFTGSCNNPAGKEKQSRSDPLALEQFFSTFLLLLLGMVFSGVLLLGENVYLKYALKRQRRLGLDGRGSPHHQLPHQVHPEDRRRALRTQLVDLNRRHTLPAPPPAGPGPGPGPGPPPPPSRVGMYMASCCALFSTSLGRSLMGDPPRMAPTRRLLAGPRDPGRGQRSRVWAGAGAGALSGLHVQLQPHDAERCAAAHKHLQAALADARARADKLERLLRAAQPQRGGGLAGVVQSVVPQMRAFSTASVATVCSRASVVHGPRWSPDGSPVRLPVSRRCTEAGCVPAPPASHPRPCPCPCPGSGNTTPHHLNSAAAYALRHEAVGAPTPPEFETVL